MSSEIASLADQDALLARLIGAAGLISSDRIVEALEEPGLRDRLDRLGLRRDERRALDAALTSCGRAEDHGPLIRKVAELKAWASQGEVERCLDLLADFEDQPAYARLAEHAVLKASAKRGLKPSAIESLKALLIQSRKAEAPSPEPAAPVEDSFGRFVRLKGAVATSKLDDVLAIYRSMPESDDYKKAGLKLVQKVCLSQALSVVRRDPDQVVVRCKSCSTPVAKPEDEGRDCALCGATVD